MGAIIGALLVAGSVAANPQMGSSNASPRHEATAQKVLVSKDAHSGYSGDRHGDNGDDPSVVIGNASGIRTIDGTGNTSTNAPVNDCGNPVNDAMGIAASGRPALRSTSQPSRLSTSPSRS